MGKKIISNLQLIVNGVVVAYVPNTLIYIKNTAENKTVALTTGGVATKAFHSQDVAESGSIVKFETRATEQILGVKDTWLKNVSENVIELSDKDGIVSESFQDMSLKVMPEIGFGTESALEFEFIGSAI